jgi:ribonuclease HII
MLIGIDEVGRGCWAGPLLVVAAKGENLPAVKDSKLLSRLQRETLYDQLSAACSFGEGWVEPAEIDEHGLTQAMRLAVKRALTALKVTHQDEIIMDGAINYCSPEFTNVQCVIKADSLHPIVSAASIYAKVTRDNYMVELARKYPGYGFEKHVGYGTAAHTQALRELGVCVEHRMSYKPIKAFM